MRLNRVLLLAASFVCMIFAMVFTISCSGDDGKNGAPGQNAVCTAANSPTGDAITITCNDGTVGRLAGTGPAGPDGPAGPQGPQGPQGPAGPAGSVPEGICVLGPQDPDTGKFSVICGGQNMGGEITGSLASCDVEEGGLNNPGRLLIKCSAGTIYTCGGWAYDPATSFCDIKSVSDYDKPDSTISLPIISPSVCAGVDYDAREKFCDLGKLYDLCNGSRYFPNDKEDCAAGVVTKQCAVSTGTRYAKYTQFCMNGKTVTPRCGTPKSDGTYSTGLSSTNGSLLPGATSGDKTIGGNLIKGEYDSNENDFCINGRVVKKCGLGANAPVYEESTHFCAAGDSIAVHCDNREIYNPINRFCSVVANPDVERYRSETGPNASCVSAPWKCKDYFSKPLPYCGSGTAAANKYNANGVWQWEYCVAKDNPTGGTTAPVLYSVFRCAVNQIPDLSNFSAEVCGCVPGAEILPAGRNGCACKVGTPRFAPYLDFASVAIGSQYHIGSTVGNVFTAASSGQVFATGSPNVYFTSAPGSGLALTPNFFDHYGGQCDVALVCSDATAANIAACSQDDCIKDEKTLYWDGAIGKCVKGAGNCTLGFGANSQTAAQAGTPGRTCYPTKQLCGKSNPSACTNQKECIAADGFWDTFAGRANVCVNSASECNSGKAGNVITSGSDKKNVCDPQ